MPCIICNSSVGPKMVGSRDCPRKVLPMGKRLTFCGACYNQHLECSKKTTDLSGTCKAALEGGQAKLVPQAQIALAQIRQDDFPVFTHRVAQGYYKTFNPPMGADNIIFGTRGCGPCLGVIAILNHGMIFCAHLDHNIREVGQPAGIDEGEAWKAAKTSIYLKLPPYDSVRKLYMTAQTPMWVTKLTIKAIREIYGIEKALIQDIHLKDAIWWEKAGNVVKAGNSNGPAVGTLSHEGTASIVLQEGKFLLT